MCFQRDTKVIQGIFLTGQNGVQKLGGIDRNQVNCLGMAEIREFI